MPSTGLILAVNCGSSSIKFQLYSPSPSLSVLVSGSASNVHSSSPAKFSFRYTPPSATPLSAKKDREIASSTEYVAVFHEILAEVTSEEVLGEWGGKEGIRGVTHRIVHGGKATKPIVIKHGAADERATLEEMDKVSDLAPLHNHHAMLIVKACLELLPLASSVLCFDTLFHSTIPDFRTTYAISTPPHPTPVPLRRYGFHGLSYASILGQMSEHLKKPEEEINLVVAHLGSGASVCLIQGGKSMNTSMGLTPLEGLPGGTRAGSVDASLIFHHTPDCSETVEWSGRRISKAEFVLNKQSGFEALTGTTDFGTIVTRAFSSPRSCTPDEQSQALLTYKLYHDRLLLYVSSYLSTLFSSPAPHNKLDGLVFSGGIGEHSNRLRRDVLESLKWIEEFAGTGGGVDEERNERGGGGKVRRITKDGSRVTAWVVETDEERELVEQAVKVLESR